MTFPTLVVPLSSFGKLLKALVSACVTECRGLESTYENGDTTVIKYMIRIIVVFFSGENINIFFSNSNNNVYCEECSELWVEACVCV